MIREENYTQENRRKRFNLLTHFLSGDTIQFFNETKCNIYEAKYKQYNTYNHINDLLKWSGEDKS